MRYVGRCGALILLSSFAAGLAAQDPVFSGPQPGEKVTPFKIRGVFGDLAGKEIDLVSQADGKPLAIIFVHEVTRPSVGLTRTLMDYAAKRTKQGLTCGVVFLDDDLTAAEARLKRASHALPTQVPIGISLDGREGPGAYGLNRNVALTVLVAKDNVVKSNFALVQPSLQADTVRIARQIAEVTGDRPPSLADLGIGPDGMPARGKKAAARGKAAPARDGEFEQKLRALIQKTNDESAVREAAAAIEKYIAENPAARERLGQITSTIVKAGKVENYGTPAAQERIRAWAQKYGPQGEENEKKE